MRLSIDLPDELHRDLKAKAATEGKTIAEVIRPMLVQFTYGTVAVKAAPKSTEYRGPITKADQARGKTRK